MSNNARSESHPVPANVETQIGERVHQLMWRRRVLQKELGEHMGISQTTISKKLRGERAFSNAELIAVARFFNVSVATLFGEKEKDPAVTPGPSDESLHTESNRRPFHYE